MPKIEGKMAARASSTGFVHMDEVFCPEENKLPGVKSMRGRFRHLATPASVSVGAAWAPRKTAG